MPAAVKGPTVVPVLEGACVPLQPSLALQEVALLVVHASWLL